MKTRILLAIFALCAGPALAQQTAVTTLSASQHGSLVSGNVPVAAGGGGVHNQLGDSGIPAANIPATIVRISRFGFVKGRYIGVTNCTITASSTTMTCAGGPAFDSTDVGDTVVEQYAACAADGTDFITTVAAVNSGTSLRLADTPCYTSTGIKEINNPGITANGAGYEIAASKNADPVSRQTMVGGSAIVAGVMQPNEWTVATVRLNAGGSGAASGSGCTFDLAPASSYAPQGVQATLTGSTSGGALLSAGLVVATGSKYLALAGYAYSAGWYLNIPVSTDPASSGCAGLTGATVDIKFGITNEVMVRNTGVYSTAPPLNVATTSNDSGSGVQINSYNANAILMSVYHDNLSPMTALCNYANTQFALNQPVTFSADAGKYGVSMLPPTTCTFNGPLFWVGDATWGTVVYMTPNTYGASTIGKVSRGEVFPVLNANQNSCSGAGTTQVQLTDSTGPCKLGVFITNTTFTGNTESTTIQNAVTCYGICGQVTMKDDNYISGRGSLIGCGLDSSNKCSTAVESNFDDLRLSFCGSAADFVPCFALDGYGATAAPNNISAKRIRVYAPNGVGIAVRPATSGNGSAKITLDTVKVENSQAFGTNASDSIQLGTSDAHNYSWPKVDGTIVTAADDTESGIGSITLINPVVTYPPPGYACIHVEGRSAADVNTVSIIGAATCAGASNMDATRGDGVGVQIDAGGNAVIVDMARNTTNDYNFLAVSTPNANQITSGALEYELNTNDGNQAPVVNIEAGALPVFCGKGVGAIAVVANKTASCPVPAANVSGLAPVATSGSATDLGTGTLPTARLAIGDGVYNSGGNLASAQGKLRYVTVGVGGVTPNGTTDCGDVFNGDGSHVSLVTLPTSLVKVGCAYTFEPKILSMEITSTAIPILVPGSGEHNYTQMHVPYLQKLGFFTIQYNGTDWRLVGASKAFYENFEPLDDQLLANGQVRFDYDGSQYFTLIPKNGPGGLIVNSQMNRIAAQGMRFDKAGTTSSALNYFYVQDTVNTGVTGTASDGGKVKVALASALAGANVGDQVTIYCWSVLGTTEANGWFQGVVTTDTQHVDLTGTTFTNAFATSPDGNCRVIWMTAATTGHTTATTSGVEVNSASIGQTLVGMAYIGAANAANDSATKRDVASWYNRKTKTCINKFTADRTTTSSTYAELNSEIECEFVTWGESDLPWSIAGGARNLTVGDGWAMSAGFDSTSVAETEETGAPVGGGQFPASVHGSKSSLGEGKHFVTILGHVITGGTQSVFGAAPPVTSLEATPLQ